jgi:hypothetical protein
MNTCTSSQVEGHFGWRTLNPKSSLVLGNYYFERGTVHAIPDILESPMIFLSIDTPRRDPKDVIFVNPEDGTPESFIQATND